MVNVLDPEFYVDPWDAYRWLRDEAPAYWDPVQELWAVSRYDDVVAVEKDGATFSSHAGSRPLLDQRADRSMINMDDPAHQAQRGLVARRFTPRAMRDHESHVRRVVTEVLDEVTPEGECDAVEAIASRVPAIVIGDMLGYPRELWPDLRRWSEQLMLLAGQTSPHGRPPVQHPDMAPVIQEFAQVTAGVVASRTEEPRDDLISRWVHAEGWDTGHVLEEVVLVLGGGAETTRTVIGTMVRDLALHPGQRRRLLDDPGLLGTTAVDEMIRWVTPIVNMRRTATAATELHGERVRPGDEVVLLYAAANRDPRAFDRPDDLDVARTPNRHVAFGFGTHFCLGAHLARLELRVVFEELLRRLPDWELVDPDEPRILPATFTRAYDRVRIRFTPSSAEG